MTEHDGPCIVCGAYDGAHDSGCILDSAPETTYTPAELADWRVLRYRALTDGGDNAPMTAVIYAEQPTHGRAGAAFATSREVIPWIDAINLEV